MSDTAGRRIVVGVSPTQSSDAVLEYAAVEAARRGCGVHLVLVEHPLWNAAGLSDVRILNGELRRADLVWLDRCERRLRRWLSEDQPVTTETTQGSPRRVLREAARPGETVVLQHHRMGRPLHLPSPSVTSSLAAHADTLVVAVPDDWHEAEAAHDTVVVGIESGEESWVVVRAALEAASVAGSRLLLVHAWTSSEEHEESPRDRLRTELAPLLARHPEVTSRIHVVYGQAEYALTQRSARARLLVVGRRRRQRPIGPHLGPVTRAVLGYAHCPVLVVGPETGLVSHLAAEPTTARVLAPGAPDIAPDIAPA